MDTNKTTTTTKVFDNESVVETSVVLSDIQSIHSSGKYSIWVTLNSDATPNVKFEILCGYNQVIDDFVAPPVPFAEDVNDKDNHMFDLMIPVTRYVIIKATGLAGNPADTTVKFVLQHL